MVPGNPRKIIPSLNSHVMVALLLETHLKCAAQRAHRQWWMAFQTTTTTTKRAHKRGADNQSNNKVIGHTSAIP